MLYFSLDLETAGVTPKRPEGILMASFVFEDTSSQVPVDQLPHFTCLIDHGPLLPGPFGLVAMAMNAWIAVAMEYAKKKKKEGDRFSPASFRKMMLGLNVPEATVDRGCAGGESYPLLTMAEFIDSTHAFFDKHVGMGKHVNVAGKNVASFDLNFLPSSLTERIRGRVLDPGPRYWDATEDGDTVPGFDKVLARAGLAEAVSHDALADARAVISVLRPTYDWRPWKKPVA